MTSKKMKVKKITCWVMFATLMLSMNACLQGNSGDPDDDAGDKSLLIGSWQIVRSEGYEIYDGDKDTFSDTDFGPFDVVTLYKDGTGTFDGDDESYSGTWTYSSGKLAIRVSGEKLEADVLQLTSKALVLEYHEIEEEDEFEYYVKATFKKI
jgi:hypothetical protein